MGALNEAATLRFLKNLPQLPRSTMDSTDRGFIVTLGLLGLLLAGVFGAAIYGSIQDDNAWVAFAPTHHCVVVGKKQGSYGTGLTSNAKMMTTYTEGTTSYHCDDGITYERSD